MLQDVVGPEAPTYNMLCWYRIPDAQDNRVMRPNLGRLSTFESRWEAWCDSIRVLIRVLQPMATARSELDLIPRRPEASRTSRWGFDALGTDRDSGTRAT